MAKTEGFNLYACDVGTCDSHDYAQENTDTADGYNVRKRIDANGIERSLMLCSEHSETYKQLVGACEAAYTQFEQDGTFALATKAQVDKLTADLAEMTASKDHWVERAKQNRKEADAKAAELEALRAEFEQYKKDHPEIEGGEE